MYEYKIGYDARSRFCSKYYNSFKKSFASIKLRHKTRIGFGYGLGFKIFNGFGYGLGSIFLNGFGYGLGFENIWIWIWTWINIFKWIWTWTWI